MPNYVLSALAKAQVKASQEFGASETRAITPTILGMACKNANITISQAEQARVHEKRVVDITFFQKIAAGVDTAKQIAHTGSKGDSAKINLNYVSMVEKFSINAKLSNNNVYSEQEIFNNQYSQAWKNLMSRMNQAALDFINANRCQLTAVALATPVTASGAGTWNLANFALEVAQGDKNLRLLKAESFMKARYFDGEYDVIADLSTEAAFKQQLFQGAGNATNTAFQFGQSNIVASQSLVSSNYPLGAFMIMPKGALACVCWNDQLNVKNTDKGAAIGLFTTVTDPFGLGCSADLSVYTGRIDSSADTVGGSTQDLKDEYELTLTCAFAFNPLTNVGDGVAHLVGLTA